MKTVELKTNDGAMDNHRAKSVRMLMASVAPRPGALVLVKDTTLRLPEQTVDSVLLQAIDVRTQLLEGRFYFVDSLAAKMDFIEYVARLFPFSLGEICTDDSGGNGDTSEHRFAVLAGRLGIRHSIARFSDNDLLAYTNRHFFDPQPSLLRWRKLDDATADFAAFMHHHNNERRLEIHHGATPAETLRDLVGRPLSFDPP